MAVHHFPNGQPQFPYESAPLGIRGGGAEARTIRFRQILRRLQGQVVFIVLPSAYVT